ncbi:hypothetical protein CY35_02G029100 [Sphagnum magellanicum]|nr:hypothetical protein CY35_02G029100 [Sphagnum magellanicum]
MQLFCLGRLFLEVVFSIQNWADDYTTSTIPSFGTEKPFFGCADLCIYDGLFPCIYRNCRLLCWHEQMNELLTGRS